MTIQAPSFNGINALAALMNGTGLANYGNTIGGKFSGNAYYAKILEMYSVVGAAGADPDDLTFDPQVDVAENTIGILATLGNNREFGSGAFTTVVPGASTSIGTGHLHNAVQAHTNRLFGASSLYMSQAIQNATGIVSNSRKLQPILAQSGNTFFGADPAENDVTAYNSANYYLGDTINNPIDMTLNGYNSLVTSNDSLQSAANDFAALGTAFNIAKPDTFGNPGQLCQAVAALEFASLIQLDVALINQGLAAVSIDDLDLPQYNQQCTAALESITNREAVRVTKDMLGITNTQIVKLSDVTDFNKLFPNNNVLVADTLEELQQDLIGLELGEFQTSAQFGTFLGTLLVPRMPSRGNENRPVQGNNIDTVANVYLYQNRSLDLSDIMGSVGGIGIAESVDAYKTAIDKLYNEGTLTALYDAAQEVIDAVQDTYISPDEKNTFVVARLDDFTAELVALHSKENINSTITDAVVAWETIAAKCATEKSIEAKFNLFLNERTGESNFAVGFISSVERIAQNANDRAFLYGLANAAIDAGDSTGEYVHAYTSEVVNYNNTVNNEARFSGGVQQ